MTISNSIKKNKQFVLTISILIYFHSPALDHSPALKLTRGYILYAYRMRDINCVYHASFIPCINDLQKFYLAVERIINKCKWHTNICICESTEVLQIKSLKNVTLSHSDIDQRLWSDLSLKMNSDIQTGIEANRRRLASTLEAKADIERHHPSFSTSTYSTKHNSTFVLNCISFSGNSLSCRVTLLCPQNPK